MRANFVLTHADCRPLCPRTSAAGRREAVGARESATREERGRGGTGEAVRRRSSGVRRRPGFDVRHQRRLRRARRPRREVTRRGVGTAGRRTQRTQAKRMSVSEQPVRPSCIIICVCLRPNYSK